MLTPGKLNLVKRPRYFEKHRSQQYDLIAALALLLTIIVGLGYRTFLEPTPSWVKLSIIGFGVLIVGAQLLHHLRARQEIRVTRKKLKVDQYSLISRKARIPLSEIEKIDEVSYPVFAQRYGGSGWLCNERFLSLIGRNGLAITTRSGKRFFVGSRTPDQLYEALAS